MRFRRRVTYLGRPAWRQAHATVVIIVLNALWFLIVQQVKGFSIQGLLAAGAVDQPDVLAGQWYRLVSSMFVHASAVHIGLNMVSLASLYVVELLVGTPAFIFIYFLTGVVGGALALALNPDTVMLGASAAIFGVFGAALMLSFQGVLSRATRNQLLIWLAINLAYGFSSPHIGNAAHIGGLVTGMLITRLLTRWLSRPWQSRRYLRWVAAVCTGLTALSLAKALV
ncbi:MAG: rhomboid family intramembrane serine protease [Alicyclobacillaceae bacterium]|nr:rhomboid family intramembrane serine protease [Alicyclobacillaceae bacterium]